MHNYVVIFEKSDIQSQKNMYNNNNNNNNNNNIFKVYPEYMKIQVQ